MQGVVWGYNASKQFVITSVFCYRVHLKLNKIISVIYRTIIMLNAIFIKICRQHISINWLLGKLCTLLWPKWIEDCCSILSQKNSYTVGGHAVEAPLCMYRLSPIWSNVELWMDCKEQLHLHDVFCWTWDSKLHLGIATSEHWFPNI